MPSRVDRRVLGVSAAVLALVLAGTWWAVHREEKAPPAAPTPSPGFRVAWPGTPQEVFPSGTSLPRVYMAHYTAKTPGQYLMYSASVTDFGPEAANEMSPRDRLLAAKAGLQKRELSRKEFEHGPNRLPGLDILSRQDERWTRERVVASATRVYSVSVTVRFEESLEDPRVVEFFDSFAVEE